MRFRYIWILTCSLTTLFLPRSGLAGIRPSQTKHTLSSLNEEIFQTISAPNKWGYTVRGKLDSSYPYPSLCHPYLSDSGLTFSLDIMLLLPGVKISSIDESEKLFCELYPNIINKLNSLKEIRPLLAYFPLDPESCQLSVMFVDEKGNAAPPPLLAGVRLNQGVVKFYSEVANAKEAPGPYKEVATRKACDLCGLKQFYQPKCLRTKEPASLREFHFSQDSWRYNTSFSQEQIRAFKELCFQTKLAITTIGSVGKNHFDARPIEFALYGPQQLNLEQSRHLTAGCLQQLLAYIQNSTLYEEFLKNWTSSPHCHHVSSTPASDQIAFRINFWDENIDRPVAPYIAEIRLLDDKLSYFTADENQCLVLVFEETVKDNLQRISQGGRLLQGERQCKVDMP